MNISCFLYYFKSLEGRRLRSKSLGGATLRATTADPRQIQAVLDAPRSPQDGPRSPQEAPRSAQDAPGASQERPRAARSGPRAVQERPRAAKRALGTILGPSCGILEPSWDQKCVFFLAFSNTFCKFVFSSQNGFRRHLGAQFAPTWVVESGQERPKSGQETLKRSPRAPQSGPRVTPERPRVAPERPKSSQERPKSDQERPKSA